MIRKLLLSMVVLLAVLMAASSGLSVALRGGWARRALLARLSAGFGRTVEVGAFGFGLLRGPHLEAQSVTVYEDPRFGQEYFLRAEQLTANLRWSALIQGRFEFDTVALTRPSLNLVRLENGQWNIENWLPPLLPAGAGTTARPRAAGGTAAQLSHIQVAEGRINFKRDSRKLALALVAVAGRFDHDAAGHWNIDVQAKPMRAPASLQEAGTLRVRGVVGGVSERLRPANLTLRWEDASLADLSRLIQGGDFGIRGTLDADLTARIDASQTPTPSWGEWDVEGTVRLQGVHGWALAARATDPSANIRLQAQWRPADYRLMISRYVVEGPQSQLSGEVDLDWSRGFHPQAQLTASRVSLADLLAWRRAFRPGLADDLALEGALEARAKLIGWPLHLDELTLASEGAAIRVAALPGPIRVGPIATEWSGEMLKVRPVLIFLPANDSAAPRARGNSASDAALPSSALLVQGTIGPAPSVNALPGVAYRASLSGAIPRTQDLLALAHAWGMTAASTWAAEGPASLQLDLAGSLGSGIGRANGTIQVHDLRLTTAFMNRPLLIAAATIDLRGDQRRINLQSVQALGAVWTGSLHVPAEHGGWEFDLSADRLDAADFYAWLALQDRPNLLQRMLPFAAAGASSQNAGRAGALENLRAHGRLRVAQLAFSPLQVEKIDAAAAIEGPSLTLRQGRADLLGGQWNGTFQVRLSPDPAYSFDGQFTRLDLHDFAGAVGLPGRLSGLASGELKLAARGADRAALAASLAGQGALRSREAALGPLDLSPTAPNDSVDPGSDSAERPATVTALFAIGAGSVRFDRLLLTRAGEQSEIAGTIDFAKRLDLRAQSSSRSNISAAGEPGQRAHWSIIGTLDAPRIASAPINMPGRSAGVPSASAIR